MKAMEKCIATTKTGVPCTQRALGADGKCLYHSEDPAIVQIRQEARSLGGRKVIAERKLRVLPSLRSPRELIKRLEELYAALLEGRASPKQIIAATKLLAEAREAYQLIVIEERLNAALQKLDGEQYLLGEGPSLELDHAASADKTVEP